MTEVVQMRRKPRKEPFIPAAKKATPKQVHHGARAEGPCHYFYACFSLFLHRDSLS